jgi:hypothetical protein
MLRTLAWCSPEQIPTTRREKLFLADCCSRMAATSVARFQLRARQYILARKLKRERLALTGWVSEQFRPSPRILAFRRRSLNSAVDFAEPRSIPMSERPAESSSNTVSDIVELAFYSTSVFFIVLLWIYVPA